MSDTDNGSIGRFGPDIPAPPVTPIVPPTNPPITATPGYGDIVGSGLGAFSGGFTWFLEHGAKIDMQAASVLGVKYGLPALLGDLAGGAGSLFGVFQTMHDVSEGDYAGA